MHLALTSPTGGAELDADRSRTIVQIIDDTEPGSAISVLLGFLLGLFAAFDPVWLGILGLPALYLGFRRWRLRRVP